MVCHHEDDISYLEGYTHIDIDLHKCEVVFEEGEKHGEAVVSACVNINRNSPKH